MNGEVKNWITFILAVFLLVAFGAYIGSEIERYSFCIDLSKIYGVTSSMFNYQCYFHLKDGAYYLYSDFLKQFTIIK